MRPSHPNAYRRMRSSDPEERRYFFFFGGFAGFWFGSATTVAE
jgi:hypothetical protein